MKISDEYLRPFARVGALAAAPLLLPPLVLELVEVPVLHQLEDGEVKPPLEAGAGPDVRIVYSSSAELGTCGYFLMPNQSNCT